MSKKTHNYPKTRKKRDTSYSGSYQLVDIHGLETIKTVWKEKGMYRTGQHFKVSPYIIRYLAHKYEWKRPAEKAPIILKGVKAGKVPADYYKCLDFSGIDTINTNSKKEKDNELHK